MADTPKPRPAKVKFLKKQVADTRVIFHTVFPLCFRDKGAEKLPLKIGIYEDLRQAFPDINRKLLSATLTDYVNGGKYLRNVIAGTSRVDLNGSFAGVVTADQEAYSQKRMKQNEGRRLKNAAMKKAKVAA